MTSNKEEVLSLVSAGKITSAEGEALLKAMSGPRRSMWQMVLNPFEHLGEKSAMGIAMFSSLAGIALSRLGVRFNGALDVNVTRAAPELKVALLEQVIAWPWVAFLAWVAALAISRKGRIVDFLAVVGIARVPLLVVAAVTAVIRDDVPENPATMASTHPVLSMFLLVVALPALAWMFVLFFQGFKTASGSHGAKNGIAFVGLILTAEITSKLMLRFAA